MLRSVLNLVGRERELHARVTRRVEPAAEGDRGDVNANAALRDAKHAGDRLFGPALRDQGRDRRWRGVSCAGEAIPTRSFGYERNRCAIMPMC